jgi:hypothetical protein
MEGKIFREWGGGLFISAGLLLPDWIKSQQKTAAHPVTAAAAEKKRTHRRPNKIFSRDKHPRFFRLGLLLKQTSQPATDSAAMFILGSESWLHKKYLQ